MLNWSTGSEIPCRRRVKTSWLAPVGRLVQQGIDATNLLPREDFAVLFVVLADADEVVALEIADGRAAETATELHKLENQFSCHGVVGSGYARPTSQ